MIPVCIFSVLFNISRFFELEVYSFYPDTHLGQDNLTRVELLEQGNLTFGEMLGHNNLTLVDGLEQNLEYQLQPTTLR